MPLTVYVVRESPARDRDEAAQLFWLGSAEDPTEAAMLAVSHGPFPFTYGDLRVHDCSTANVIVVSKEQRDWRIEQERLRVAGHPPL